LSLVSSYTVGHDIKPSAANGHWSLDREMQAKFGRCSRRAVLLIAAHQIESGD
jgi:hypothetical protein